MQLPARSVVASGIVGLAGWGLSLLAAQFGFVVPPEAMTPAITALVVIVAHFVPDSLKDHAAALNVKVQDLENWIPTVQSGPNDYPDSPNRSRH